MEPKKNIEENREPLPVPGLYSFYETKICLGFVIAADEHHVIILFQDFIVSQATSSSRIMFILQEKNIYWVPYCY